MSLTKNSSYCAMPYSTKCSDTCYEVDQSGPEFCTCWEHNWIKIWKWHSYSILCWNCYNYKGQKRPLLMDHWSLQRRKKIKQTLHQITTREFDEHSTLQIILLSHDWNVYMWYRGPLLRKTSNQSFVFSERFKYQWLRACEMQIVAVFAFDVLRRWDVFGIFSQISHPMSHVTENVLAAWNNKRKNLSRLKFNNQKMGNNFITIGVIILYLV